MSPGDISSRQARLHLLISPDFASKPETFCPGLARSSPDDI
ncbi:hypothetical protein A2U01_0056102 [Trifolium medium]|uniref:Uncharacterized protein n=1 Tax=Trifolium medium TaxID=97028 RepID=A0A392RE89_9FABA|nr:hypothetical protein [Trifolium medium]